MKKMLLGIILLNLVGCDSLNYVLYQCVYDYNDKQECEKVANFKTKSHCSQYKIIYQSAINYDELESKGLTTARYYTSSNSDVYCQEK